MSTMFILKWPTLGCEIPVQCEFRVCVWFVHAVVAYVCVRVLCTALWAITYQPVANNSKFKCNDRRAKTFTLFIFTMVFYDGAYTAAVAATAATLQ